MKRQTNWLTRVPEQTKMNGRRRWHKLQKKRPQQIIKQTCTETLNGWQIRISWMNWMINKDNLSQQPKRTEDELQYYAL